jgi:hypothetical protein
MEQRHKFSRAELYDLVWAEPIIKLAAKYGISDVGLAKACKRAGVPVPPRGHWARIRHGKKSAQPPLPPAEPGQSETVEIEPAANKLVPPAPELSAETQKKVEAEQKEENKIRVPTTLSNPHRIIAAHIEERRRTSHVYGNITIPAPLKLTELEKRRLRFLSALFKESEKRGYRVETKTTYLHDVRIVVDEERIEIHVNERWRQRRVELSPDEKKRSENLLSGQAWKLEREDTGELTFKVRDYVDRGIKTSWADRVGMPIEDQLNSIIAGFAIISENLKKRRHEREEEQRQWREEEERRQAKIQARRDEMERFRGLIGEVTQWKRANDIRSYVDAVRLTAQERPSKLGPSELEKWNLWALRHADRIDPLKNEKIGQGADPEKDMKEQHDWRDDWEDDEEPENEFI